MFIEFEKLFWKRRKKFGGLKKLSKLFSIVIIQFWNLVYKCQKICFLKIKFYSAKMTRINIPLILLMSNSWTIWKCETTIFFRKVYIINDLFSIYRKVPKEFHLAYDKLEDRPSLPTNLSGQHGGVPATPSSGGSPAPPMAGGPGGDRGGIGGGVGGNGPMGMGQQQGPNQMSPNMNSGPLQPPPGGL